MSKFIRVSATVLFFLFSPAFVFSWGQAERTQRSAEDLIEEGNFEGAWNLLLDGYEEEPEGFDDYFDDAAREILAIDNEYAKLMLEFNQAAKSADLDELYRIIGDMEALKPDPEPSYAKIIVSANRLAGAVVNKEELERIMNEALTLLESGEYVDAKDLYLSGFDLNLKVFEDSEFETKYVDGVTAAKNALLVLAEEYEQTVQDISRLEQNLYQTDLPAGETARDLTLNEISTIIGDLETQYARLAELRFESLLRRLALVEIRTAIAKENEGVKDEFGQSVDLNYFYFLDSLINGRGKRSSTVGSEDNSRTVTEEDREGLLRLFELEFLQSAEKLLAFINEKVSTQLAAGDAVINQLARSYTSNTEQTISEAETEFNTLKNYLELAFSVINSWQNFAYLNSDGELTEAGYGLYQQSQDDTTYKTLDQQILPHYTWYRNLEQYAELQIDLAEQYRELTDNYALVDQTGRDELADIDPINGQLALLYNQQDYIKQLQSRWDSISLETQEIDKIGYDVAAADQVASSAADSLTTVFAATRDLETEYSTDIFAIKYNSYSERFTQYVDKIDAAEAGEIDIVAVEQSDLLGGTITVDIAENSINEYQDARNLLDSLQKEIAETLLLNSNAPEYVLETSQYSGLLDRGGALQESINTRLQQISENLAALELHEAEQRAAGLLAVAEQNLNKQLEVYDSALTKLDDPLSQTSERLSNTGSRTIFVDYPGESETLFTNVKRGLEGVLAHIVDIGTYVTEQAVKYEGNELFLSVNQSLAALEVRAEEYSSSAAARISAINLEFARNSARARLEPLIRDFSTFSDQLTEARTSTGQTVAFRAPLNNAATVTVRIPEFSMNLAEEVIDKLGLLASENNAVASVLANLNSEYDMDTEITRTTTRSADLATDIQNLRQEVEIFVQALRLDRTETIAQARRDDLRNKYSNAVSAVADAQDNQNLRTTQTETFTDFPSIPAVDITFSFAVLDVFNEQVENLNEYYNQIDTIQNNLQQDGYWGTSEILGTVYGDLDDLQVTINNYLTENADFEFNINQQYSFAVASKLGSVLAQDVQDIRSQYSRALTRPTQLLRDEVQPYDDMQFTASYPVQTVSELNNLLENIPDLLQSLESTRALLGSSRFSPYRSNSAGNTINATSAELGSLISEVNQITDSISSQITQYDITYNSDITTRRITKIRADYQALANIYDNALEKYNGIPGDTVDGILRKYPLEAYNLLNRRPEEANRLAEKISAVIKKFDGMDAAVLDNAGINTRLNTLASQLSSVSELENLMTELRLNANRQFQLANSYINEAERFFEAAENNFAANELAAAINYVEQSRNSYYNSLEQSWNDTIRNIINNELVRLQQEIVAEQLAQVEATVAGLVAQAYEEYFNQDFRAAKEYIDEAEQEWQLVFFDRENKEIEYWKSIIEAGNNVQSNIELNPADPLYSVYGTYLQWAYDNFREGKALYASNRTTAISKLNSAKEYLNKVTLDYPSNRRANVLQLEIEQVIDPANFMQKVREKFNDALARVNRNNGSDPDNSEAYNEMLDIKALLDKTGENLPGLSGEIERMEYLLGIRIAVDNTEANRAVDLFNQAQRIFNAKTYSQYARALDLVEQSLELDRTNREAYTLRISLLDEYQNLFNESLGGVQIPSLSVEDIQTLNVIKRYIADGTENSLLSAFSLLQELEGKSEDVRSHPDVRKAREAIVSKLDL